MGKQSEKDSGQARNLSRSENKFTVPVNLENAIAWDQRRLSTVWAQAKYARSATAEDKPMPSATQSLRVAPRARTQVAAARSSGDVGLDAASGTSPS